MSIAGRESKSPGRWASDVFKALTDPHRRNLLDRLYERDGQTLSELQSYLPLSRFGCMKHLRVLEDAGLVTSRKVGREKFHFLNPVPIQGAYDLWVEKFARPWTRMISGLKWSLDEPSMPTKPAHVYLIYIQANPDVVWQAITDPEMTEQYFLGTLIESDFVPGSPYVYRTPDGTPMLDGTIVESDPPHRLVMTFRPVWTAEGETAPVSRVTWEITPHEDQTRVALIHEGLDLDSEFGRGVQDGWTQIISAMKTVLETQRLPVGAGD
jgi:uncharacterized protein YndB with AHSA1/START domain/DNA-binding transcriptional ArsR family regulator